MNKNFFLIIIILGLFSCQKEITDEVSTTNTNIQVDVYVAGFVSDDGTRRYNYPSNLPFPGSREYPSYWKNGNLVKLDSDVLPNLDGEGYVGGRALSIAVSGNDIYVSGTGLSNGPYRQAIAGLFWKNSVRDYGLYQSSALSLKVSNNDVYMVGYSLGIVVPSYSIPATYYKNGDLVFLDGPEGSATSIAVSGNDVYVAGVSFRNQKFIAKYWKNGNPVNLTDGSNSAEAWSIAVSGTDVYVAGTEWNGNSYQDANGNTSRYGIPKYWKNGQVTALTNGTSPAVATSIAVVSNDVYVSGTENGVAKYWKNGNPVNLTDGSKWAEARSIAVSGNDVYVAGFEDGVAKYWKNGNPVILGDASKYSEAYSIFLVKK